MNRLIFYFTINLRSQDALTKEKGRLLAIFKLTFLALIFFLHIALALVNLETVLRLLKVTPILPVGVAFSLYYLRQGDYHKAATIFVSLTSFVAAVGMIMNSIVKPTYSLTTYSFFVFAAMSLATIFTKRKILTILFFVFSASFFISYFNIHNALHQDREMLQLMQTVLIDSYIAFVISYIVFIFVLRIFYKNMDLTTLKAKQNKQKSDFINNEIQTSSSSIQNDMQAISSQTQRLLEHIQEQSSSTEEISASLEEFIHGVHDIQKRAQTQDKDSDALHERISRQAKKLISLSNEVDNSIAAVHKIIDNAKSGQKSLKELQQMIAQLDQSSGQMTNIVNIIHDISDQTNLLSLNAAIEAARAGQAGRGFAIVADEISKLSDKTQTSTGEIARLIQANDNMIKKGFSHSKMTVDLIQGIVEDIQQVGQITDSIFASIESQNAGAQIIDSESRKFQESFRGIVTITDEQKRASDEISGAINQISDLSQKNIEQLDNLNQSIQNIRNAIEKQKENVDNFKASTALED